jgi:DNA invertase Pin-like site-specific DNA recombinase
MASLGSCAALAPLSGLRTPAVHPGEPAIWRQDQAGQAVRRNRAQVTSWPVTEVRPRRCNISSDMGYTEFMGEDNQIDNTPLRVVLYARVSKLNGHQDPENQLAPLRLHCAAKGFIVVKEYVERMSGAKETRPQLDELMADAEKGRVDFQAVLVWKFDRFARSVKHLLKALETFNALSIGFISLTESIDTSTAYGKMVFTILGAVAELERSLIIERTKAGLKRSGRKPGRKIDPIRGPSRMTLWRRAQTVQAAAQQARNPVALLLPTPR